MATVAVAKRVPKGAVGSERALQNKTRTHAKEMRLERGTGLQSMHRGVIKN